MTRQRYQGRRDLAFNEPSAARSWLGTGLDAAAALLAFAWLPVALLVIAVLPLIFVIPNLLSAADA